MKSLQATGHTLLHKYGSILKLSFTRFYTERRLLWAASLTFTTIFSLIPLLSMLFFLFNLLGNLSELKSLIQPYIYKTLAPGAQEKILTLINNLVNNIDFETIGTLSATIVVISVFLLLFEIEYALNEIWLIKKKMSIVFRAAIYWTVLTIVPLLLAVSLFIIATLNSFKAVKIIETYITFNISPWLLYGSICLAFTGIYFFMAGARVKLWSAFFGGIIAGTLWKIAAFGFTIYTSKFFFFYPQIYGPLSAIPMFLLWLFLCWVLFLLGAEITYLHQNYPFYGKYFKGYTLSDKTKEQLSLLIVLFIADQFKKQKLNVSLVSISQKLKIPLHIVQDLVIPMLNHGILNNASDDNKCIQPDKHLTQLKLSTVLKAVDHNTALTEEYYNRCDDAISKNILQSLHSYAESSYLNKTIEELLHEQYQKSLQ